MGVFSTVLAVIGAVVVLIVLAVVAFFVVAKGRVRRAFATQRQELSAFPAWGRDRGLTHAEIDNEVVRGLDEYSPFRTFATPGAYCRALHVFRGERAGSELAVLQLTAYTDPRPEATPQGILTVATTGLPRPVADVVVAPERRGLPTVHARGDRATCYLTGPLTLARAEAVADRLAAYVEGLGTARNVSDTRGQTG